MGVFDKDITFQSSIPVPLDITVAVVYSVFGICSLFGNSSLLYVSYKKKEVLKPAEYFIINLAVSDLGLTLSLYPLAISSSFYHRWLYGRTVCSVYAFCGMLFGICSLTTLTLLSIVCFVKVCYPHYGNRFNRIHGCLLIAFAWFFALFFACCPLVHWGEYGPEPYGTACCINWRLSNQLPTARSYTVVLFFFCYILPFCVILASYTGILATVHASHKTMKQHASRRKHMSSIQVIIIKLSIAVCIGFFIAWSPYALMSMWAAFGNIDNIPPLAFAMPAMFAKSSTIYNPIIYLTLRPNFRKIICKDLGTLKNRLCSWNKGTCCCCWVKIRVRLRLAPEQTQPPVVVFRGHKDAFDCSTLCPQVHGVTKPVADGQSLKDRDILPKDKEKLQRRSLLCQMCAKTTADSLHIDLQMVPGKQKVAWP